MESTTQTIERGFVFNKGGPASSQLKYGNNRIVALKDLILKYIILTEHSK